jgi:hypothetical protein
VSTNVIEPDPLASIFSPVEWVDVLQAAAERGVNPIQLVKDAVANDLYR